MKKTVLKGINGHRKAFLFTFSLVVLALSILSFTKFISQESADEKLLLQASVIYSRLYETDNSLQNCIKDAFDSFSNIEVSSDNLTLMIEEPFPNSLGAFESSISKLGLLAGYNGSGVHLDTEDISDLRLNILPQNIVYLHNSSQDYIMISFPSDAGSLLTEYHLRLSVQENVSCAWSYTNGDFDLDLEVLSSGDSGCDNQRSIDLSKNPSITITSKADSQRKIIITFSEDTFTLMNSIDPLIADIRSIMDFAVMPEQVWLGNSTINIDFPGFRTKKSGGTRII